MSRPRRLSLFHLLPLMTVLLAGCAPSSEPRGDSPETFYRSNDVIEMVVSWSAGGGTDAMGRLTAPFLSRHLPGQPRVQVVNIIGGGGIEGHNTFALRRRPDGLSLLFSAGSSHMAYLLGEPGIRFDFANMRPVFAVPAGAVIYARPGTGVSKVEDLLHPRETLRFGSIGVASTDALVLLAFHVLGLDVRTIFGYEGSGSVRIAFERGEVNINRDGTIAYLGLVRDMVEEGRAVPLFSFGQIRGGNMVRDPAFPDLPTIAEAHAMLRGTPPEGPDWDLFMSVSQAVLAMEKVLWFKQEVPEAAVQAVRGAVVRLAADPEFRERATAIMGPYDLIAGEDVVEAAETMFTALSPANRQAFIRFLVDHYDLEPR